MIYKMTLKDSVDTMTFNLLETPIVDKDIEGAVDNVTLDGNQYTDYLYLKKQYIQKWAIMCPDEYDELRGFYTRQFEDGEVPSYRVYYGANVTRDYTLSGDYLQFNAEGIETGMTLSQLLGNAEQTTYSGKNLLNINATPTTAHATRSISGQSITVTTDNQATTARVTLPIEYEANREMTISFDATCLTYEPTATNTVTVYMRTTGQSDPTTPISVDKTVGTTVHYTKTFTPDNDTKDFWFYLKSSPVAGVVSYRFDNVQVEYGASATAYEQFVGGTASPNPDYPQPISTVTGEQTVQVTGKNLVEDTISGSSIDAIGRIRSNSDFDTQVAFVIEGETYTLSYTGEIVVGGYFATKPTMNSVSIDGTRIVDNNKTFVAQYTGYFTFRTNAGESNAQCELGSTATAYEPYQGQSYEINLGKNLWGGFVSSFNFNSGGLSGYTNNADGTISIPAGTTTATSYSCDLAAATSNNYFITLKAGSYVVSGGTSDVTLQVITSSNTSLGTSFTIAADTEVLIRTRISSGVTMAATTIKPQIEAGSVATSYSAYFTPIELAKIPDTDYRDKILYDKTSGKWYIEKQVGKVVLDGTETWASSGATVYYTSALASSVADTPATAQTLGLSDYFEVVGFDYRTGTNLYFHPNKNLQTSATNWGSLSAWTTWLSTHNTTVYYALATPTTTEITDETLLLQLNFLASLYKGENNISLVGTGAQGEMEVFIRDVMSVETDVVPEVPVRLTLTDDGVINACGCRRNVQLTMRETVQ